MASLPTFKIGCPYCGEIITVLVDDSALEAGSGAQHYVEDCQVCCRPIAVASWIDEDGDLRVSATAEDEA